MRRSEIFESFIKIAQDKGLISEDAPEKAIKQLSKTHRHDSLSADDIAKLYGVKPDAPKSMEYKRNIIEDAHPDLVVVSPAHDKINGLYPNNNQRQDIILNIVNKPTDGQLTNHKWAEKNLLLTLVRLGNDLDNKGKDQLRSLSDACLSQVSHPLKKEAWAVPVIAGAALLLGALYAQQHLPFANEGLQRNSEKLVSEIDQLLESNANWGVGVKYKQEFLQEMQEFKNKILDLTATANSAQQVISTLQKPREAKEVLAIAKLPETNEVNDTYKTLQTKLANMTPYFRTILANFSNQNYKNSQIEQKGALTGLLDKTEILHGGAGLVADDFDDVRRALVPFKQSFVDVMSVLRESGSIVKKAKADLEASAQEFSNEEAPKAPAASPEAPHNEELNQLESQLTGLIPGMQ